MNNACVFFLELMCFEAWVNNRTPRHYRRLTASGLVCHEGATQGRPGGKRGRRGEKERERGEKGF